MSEVFQTFAEMMLAKSRATLTYRPQAKRYQERSAKTMIQTVRVYVEDSLQADKDDIAEIFVYANFELKKCEKKKIRRSVWYTGGTPTQH